MTFKPPEEDEFHPAADTAGAVAAGLRNIALEYRYDYLGRRVQKLVIDATANRLIYGRRFLYDGWNLIAEFALNAQLYAPTLVRSYTWGLDIARTLSEAGGVGALLQIADHPSGKTYFPAYDGNGNIVALLNSTETTRIVNGVSTTYPAGSVAAAYEYSPFGEQLRADAPDSVVADQPFRFSTKYTDSETGLVYYGRRYYDAGKGRFVGRDPIEEQSGLNLYGFVGNNGVNHWDYLGMEWAVKNNGDGIFSANAWDVVDGMLLDLGAWNFSSELDANNWAFSRSDWNFDERSGLSFQRFVRGWDSNDPSNLADSEYWTQADWDRWGDWRSADGYASAFDFNLGYQGLHNYDARNTFPGTFSIGYTLGPTNVSSTPPATTSSPSFSVRAYVWNAEGSWVGHVMVTNSQGTLAWLSQYPHQEGGSIVPFSTNDNYRLSVSATFREQGRAPDGIYAITLTDASAFVATVRDHVFRPDWDWYPSNTVTQTHCAYASYFALQAGGLVLPRNTGQILPGTVNDYLRGLASNSGGSSGGANVVSIGRPGP